MKILLTTTLFLLVSLSLIAQNQSVEISGRIFNFDSPVSDVHIYNMGNKYGTISGRNGAFKIIVKSNDTLRISHLNYKTIFVNITDDVLKHKTLILYLDLFTNYLETVEIKNHRLSGVLENDARKIDKDSITKWFNYIQNLKDLAKLPSSVDDEIRTEAYIRHDVNPIKMNGAGGSFGIPIKDKANILRSELRVKKSTPQKIISSLGKEYFTTKLLIPEEKIHHFLTYCDYRNIYSLYTENKIIELMTILEVESKGYLKIEE